jgi:hypothetical protein
VNGWFAVNVAQRNETLIQQVLEGLTGLVVLTHPCKSPSAYIAKDLAFFCKLEADLFILGLWPAFQSPTKKQGLGFLVLAKNRFDE